MPVSVEKVSELEIMPTDVCQFFYECAKCEALLRSKSGDCCVYCSHDSVKCQSDAVERSVVTKPTARIAGE